MEKDYKSVDLGWCFARFSPYIGSSLTIMSPVFNDNDHHEPAQSVEISSVKSIKQLREFLNKLDLESDS